MVKLLHHFLFEPTNLMEQLSLWAVLCVVLGIAWILVLAFIDDRRDL
jgi:hypothetical protein